MKKGNPALQKTLLLSEYLLAAKYYMKEQKCPHMTGFVNAPMLSAKPTEEELSSLVESAMKHGVITASGEETVINREIYTFINAWAHSENVVVLKKPSYGDKRMLSFAKVKEYYLAMVQDASSDKVEILADPSIEVIYDALAKEITKKDPNKNFKRKAVNKDLQKQGRDLQYKIDPLAQLVLITINNRTGKKYDNEHLFHVGKEQFESVRLEPVIRHIELKYNVFLKNDICEYIVQNTPDPTDRADGGQGKSAPAQEERDPEFYTNCSYMKMTSSKEFPGGLKSLLMSMAGQYARTFADWKRILRGLLFALGAFALTAFWNLYALCYLNDTFNLSRRARWGNASAYLFAGVADNRSVIGLPNMSHEIKTVYLTAGLYFLLAICLRSLASDTFHGKLPGVVKKLFTYPKMVGAYLSVVPHKLVHYFWGGVAGAAILNMLLLNPFTVVLLALALLVSCSKCEEGKITPIWMIFSCSARYGKVESGKKERPLYGELQLKLTGLGMGLLLCSLFNLILWHTVKYNFWVRLTVSVLLLIFATLKHGGFSFRGKKAAVAAVIGFICLQAVLFWNTGASVVLADDGGWSESGSSLAGLMNNMGWQTILAFSLTLAAAAAIGCLTLGLGTPIVMAAAGSVFATSALGATFTETGRKAAYDFVWGNYSPYGGDSKLAAGLALAVSLVPGFGDAFGVVTGIRDVSYDIKEGDWLALGLDSFGLVMDVHGLAGDFSDIMKSSDDILGFATRNGDELIEHTVRNGDEIIEHTIKNGDEVIEHTIKNGDEIIEHTIKNGDEVIEHTIKNGDEVIEHTIKNGDEVIEHTIKNGDEVIEHTVKNGDEVVEHTVKNGDEAIEQTAKKTGDAAADASKSDVITDGSHMENGKPKPNVTYKTGEHDYYYTTNDKGYIVEAKTDNLELKDHSGRLKHNSKTIDKEAGDHAGHLFGDRFGGSPELDNLVSQAKDVNISEFKKIENTWADALADGKKVTVDIKIDYPPSGGRPTRFDVNYTIDGEPFHKRIRNVNKK